MPSFRLVMRSGPSVGKVFPLNKPEITVGRDLNNDIIINDPEVSRRHARLFLQGNTYILEDFGSTNGTFINGQRLAGPYALQVGIAITFGERINLVFELDEAPLDATVISRPQQTVEPVYQPVQPPPAPSYQPPAYQPPPQPQAYSAQPQPQAYAPQQMSSQPSPAQDMYAGQIPYQAPPVKPGGRNMRTIIILVVVLLLVTCACVAIGLYFAPKEFWCAFPVWPEGACP